MQASPSRPGGNDDHHGDEDDGHRDKDVDHGDEDDDRGDKDAGHNDHNEVAAGEPVVPREGGGRCAAFHDHRTTRKVFIFCFHHIID